MQYYTKQQNRSCEYQNLLWSVKSMTRSNVRNCTNHLMFATTVRLVKLAMTASATIMQLMLSTHMNKLYTIQERE